MSATDSLELDPARAALIIQDMQNDVIIEGGAFADSGAPAHAIAQGAVANVQAVAQAFRAAGAPVIHIWYIVEPGAAGLKLERPPVRRRQRGQCARPRELGSCARGRTRATRRRSRGREDADERVLRDEA